MSGRLSRAGKVKRQTPRMEKSEKKRKKSGRARSRIKYRKRLYLEANRARTQKTPNQQPKKYLYVTYGTLNS